VKNWEFIKDWNITDSLFLLVAAVLIMLYFIGIPSVPFHPDESTQIFMSTDFSQLFKDPTSLIWSPGSENTLRGHYHLLDAPLSRYVIGLGRQVFGMPSISNDWDWTKTWQENQSAGALPDSKLLNISRYSVAILFPFSLLLIYFIGKMIQGRITGWTAALLFGLNPLILLHTRRAMAESILVFTIILALFVFITIKKPVWVWSIPAALAFNAKQSNIFLFFSGFAGIFLPYRRSSFGKKSIQAAIYLGIFISIILILNPFLWRYPFQAAKTALLERSQLAASQVAMLSRNDPARAIDTIPMKILSFVAEIYFTPPSVAEVTNYLPETEAQTVAYFSNPYNTLLSGAVINGLIILFTIVGFTYAARQFRIQSKDIQRRFAILGISTLSMILTLLAIIPLAIQRYYLPAVPFLVLWAGYGISQIAEAIEKKRSPVVSQVK
jgi:4-amino-4-deoxy-L-arabinose transferase-like glycosyltransferase